MKLILKNIKYAAFASEETHCYEATLYANGKAVAKVGNDGHGGPDRVYETNKETMKAVYAYIDSLPKEVTDIKESDGTFWEMDQSLETICGNLVNDFLVLRDVKKALKRVIYTKPNSTDIWELKPKWKPTPDFLAEFKKENPTYRILNSLPVDEVVKIWRTL